MPMGQVEDPSYGIRGGATEERSAAGAPSSAHTMIRKGYKLQGLRDGFTPYEDRALCSCGRSRDGWLNGHR